MLLDINNRNISTSDSIGKDAEIIKPSVLTQTHAHGSRSDRYSLVKTADIIKAFETAGFKWHLVKEEKSRSPEYKGFGTHMLCFEHPEISVGHGLDKELTPRLYFRNSYHGRTKMLANFGFLRAFCLNGLMVGNSLGSIVLKHIGLDQGFAEQVIVQMRKEFSENLVPTVVALKDQKMSKDKQLEFAKLAFLERLKTNDKVIRGEHEKLLTVNRPEDAEDNAWNVFQRVQENLGLNFGRSSPVDISYIYEATDEHGTIIHKERKMSSISGIQAVSHMNQFLFDRILDFLPAKNESVLICETSLER